MKRGHRFLQESERVVRIYICIYAFIPKPEPTESHTKLMATLPRQALQANCRLWGALGHPSTRQADPGAR